MEWHVKGGWSTPKGEKAEEVVVARFCDHVPPFGKPQRLEYERRLWQGLMDDSSPLPQCHVQTFPFYPGNRSDASKRRPSQEDGASGLDGECYYESEHLRTAHTASKKLLLLLSSAPIDQSDALAITGNKEGRVTYAATPSLAVAPHRFTLHRLCATTPMVNPGASRSPLEIKLKEEVLQHRHFWGHQEVSVGPVPSEAKPTPGGKDVIVFLDRDGVLNPQPAYNTGPQDMRLIPGSAAAVETLKRAGLRVAVVSSQACVGKGFVHTKDVSAVMDRMCRLMREEVNAGATEQGEEERGGKKQEAGGQGTMDAAQPDCIMFTVGAGSKAVHKDYEDTSDAKPAPTSLLRGAAALGFRQGSYRGYMVGDRLTDLQAGAACRCKVILVRTGAGVQTEATMAQSGEEISGFLGAVDNLAAAAQLILSDLSQLE